MILGTFDQHNLLRAVEGSDHAADFFDARIQLGLAGQQILLIHTRRTIKNDDHGFWFAASEGPEPTGRQWSTDREKQTGNGQHPSAQDKNVLDDRHSSAGLFRRKEEHHGSPFDGSMPTLVDQVDQDRQRDQGQSVDPD